MRKHETRSVQRLMPLLLLIIVASCATVGPPVNCGPNDRAIRMTPEQIATLTDEQVSAILIRNEELYKRGCAIPNR